MVSAFQIARYPITNAQYQVFTRAADGYIQGRWWDYSDAARKTRAAHPLPPETVFAGRHLPRTNICWYDALAFCFWLNWKVGLAPKAVPYTGKGVITLPSEQQWQRAAQGDDSRSYPWGSAPPDQNRVNFGGLVNSPSPVTKYPEGVSPFGVRDMSGNVWEWCLTTYEGNAVELRTAALRVLCGGAWDSPPEDLTVNARTQAAPDTISDSIGFRIAHAITGEGQ